MWGNPLLKLCQVRVPGVGERARGAAAPRTADRGGRFARARGLALAGRRRDALRRSLRARQVRHTRRDARDGSVHLLGRVVQLIPTRDFLTRRVLETTRVLYGLFQNALFLSSDSLWRLVSLTLFFSSCEEFKREC